MKLKMFVEDDSALVCEHLVEMLLQIRNVEIIGQTDYGIEVQNLILKKHPDAVIMDIWIPGKNGVKVLNSIRK